MCLSGTAFGPSLKASAGFGWVSMKRPATPTPTPARASTGTISRAPPLDRAQATGLLHRVGDVEHHRRARVAHFGEAGHVGHQVVVAEADAPLASQEAVFGQTRPSRAAARALSMTFFMSQGARNWPFLMFTGLPLWATARMKSVWRHRKAGVCSTSTTLATSAIWRAVVHVGQHRQAGLAAHLIEDLQAGFDADVRVAELPEERLALSKEPL